MDRHIGPRVVGNEIIRFYTSKKSLRIEKIYIYIYYHTPQCLLNNNNNNRTFGIVIYCINKSNFD